MAMMWTDAQQKVIDTRNKNLLVSAAAGSGKTAVLVERIISMISEGENPLDIDHLLVVTFTNAAAAQMRDRIGKALDKKLLGEPGNAHLQKQSSLLQSAHITTIHSFCLNIIRNYFHHIDLDPSFKMAEESEITLMKSDVIADVLEGWYEEGREDFHRLIESYSYSKSDIPIEDLVLSLYNFAMSNPWPKAWLGNIGRSFKLDTIEDMNKSPWMKELLAYVAVVILDLKEKIEAAIAVCNESDGPEAYLPALISDRKMLSGLMNIDSYEGYGTVLSDISYTRLSSKRQPDVAEHKKDRVKGLRNEMKKGIKDLTSSFFFQPIEDMLNDMQSVGEVMEVLSELTLDFMEAFAAKKEDKNLIDFNDLEHFALGILIEEKEGEIIPSKAAMELSELFDEILIDEYQDSNLVQETILRAISREHIGESNRFMVGDVKQSIYKFRLAMPELFLEKYKTYGTYDKDEDGKINLSQRIDLDKNFRSRKTILDFVNVIFEQIMTEPIGGIHYDDAASLKYGELFEELMFKGEEKLASDIEERIARDVELILVTDEEPSEDDTLGGNKESVRNNIDNISGENPSLFDDEEEMQYSKKELEARAIAIRIKELIDPEKGLLLFDKDKDGNYTHRPAKLKDIVILLRTMTGWSDVFVNTLMQEGIPAYADTGTGYFQTIEIMTILNMLRIIDNPRQDIPFTGVLYSKIGGLTTDELTHVRLMDKNETMYKACLIYAEEGSNEDLRDKVKTFLEMLHVLRGMVKYTSIHELIQQILDMTGYSYYVMAMPGGDRRKANIDMLISLAVGFTKGSYSSLFHFIRYVEKLQKYDVDYGEASISGEDENTVRIMSIHKSKGLEFPVVFVGGLSKQFNMQDQRSKILFDVDYGVGPDYIDLENRTKVQTLLKKVIQKKTQIDNLGEELRVLYVAMTRAKEKLIMTGYLKSVDDMNIQKDFSFFELMSVKSYLELVLPAMNNVFTDYMKVSLLNKSDIILEEIVKQKFLEQDYKDIESEIIAGNRDEDIQKDIEKRLYFSYPYKSDSKLRVKLSVSELKKLGQFIDDEDSELLNYISDDRYIPDFIKGPGIEITGTDRGTLYHKVLE
ncbi:MAG: UvrD-helicase domain-containing protein, partial [Clostridiales bacterium]|nr:UvrD-helicase domain-containing protein [Clostridiales bacterium]